MTEEVVNEVVEDHELTTEDDAVLTICDRIAMVMDELPARLPKDETNKHKNYDYISAPFLLEVLRPLLAKHGLVFWMTEKQFELVPQVKTSGSVWLKITYELGLSTGERVKPVDCEIITQMVPLYDPQSIAASATYAKKYYLLRKFCISTGEPALEVDATHRPASYTKLPPPKAEGGNIEFVREEVRASSTPEELTSALMMARDECSRSELKLIRVDISDVARDNGWTFDTQKQAFVVGS